MKKMMLVMLLPCLLTHCSSRYASDAEHQYLASRNGVDLVVPSPLVSTDLSEFYHLPAQNQDPNVSILPPTMKKVA